ncbi:MAG: YafY family protein [Thermodesulfobacteriota bacterium]
MRGDQLSRQWRIIRQIEASKTGLTAMEIANLGNVSLRTAYRDLDDLQYAGFPIYTDKGEHGQRWKFIESYKATLPVPFTYTELMSLHLSRDLFKVFQGTVFAESLETLFDKILAQLAPDTLTYLNKIQSTFHMGIRPYKDYKRFRELIAQVNQAALDRRCIEIAYQPLKDDAASLRKVEPYKIWFYEGTIYIIGYCHLRNQIRTFVLDRVHMLNMLDEPFEIPDKFDFQQYIRHGFKVMHDELYTVRIMISPGWARYVGEKIWHESQMIQKHLDGAIEIIFRVAGLDEIKRWVLGLGPEAFVVAPEELKEMVQADLERSLEQYRQGTLFQAIAPEEDLSNKTESS